MNFSPPLHAVGPFCRKLRHLDQLSDRYVEVYSFPSLNKSNFTLFCSKIINNRGKKYLFYIISSKIINLTPKKIIFPFKTKNKTYYSNQTPPPPPPLSSLALRDHRYLNKRGVYSDVKFSIPVSRKKSHFF